MNAHELLAKTDPYKPLWQHMADVGYAMEQLLHTGYKGFLKQASAWAGWDEAETAALLCYIAAMHDIGKAHPLFQSISLDMKKRLHDESIDEPTLGNVLFRHEKYSETLLRSYLAQRLTSKKMIRNLPSIDALHHQGKIGEQRPIYLHPAPWKQMQDALEAQMYSLFSFDPALSLETSKNVDTFCTVTLGLVILADWIASGEMQMPMDTNSLTDYADHAKKAAALAAARCGLSDKDTLPQMNDYCDYWPWLREPRPIQRAIKDITAKSELPGLTIIEAPMGEGKSEAALYAAIALAAEKRGLYFALPTSATSNQMYHRVKALFASLGGGSVRLLHSAAWANEQIAGSMAQGNGEDMSAWLMPLRRGLLSYNAVGTVDQVMLSIMHVKYGVIRLAGLLNKVLIIDEVHAYDMYMSQIINRLLQWCAALEVPVILLSATLPNKKKQALLKAYTGKDSQCQTQEYPLITCAYADKTVLQIAASASRHTVLHMKYLPIMGKYEEIAQKAVACISNGGCLCVIVNTVDAAQKLYKAVREIAADDVWLKLWHARFPAGQRIKIEQTCEDAFSKDGKRPKKAILVATQVAEQSCDYSFDYMFTELAPIDLLLQRSGRLHRHPVGLFGKIEPELTVLMPAEEGYGVTGYVYKPYLLDQTVKVLEGCYKVKLPEDMRKLIEGVYDELPETDSEAWLAYQFGTDMERARGESMAMKPPAEDRFVLPSYFDHLAEDDETGMLSAATRLGEPSENLIFLEEGEDMPEIEALLMLSCSLRRSITVRQGKNGYSQPEKCEGRLKGYSIIRTKSGVYEGVTEGQSLQYQLDSELGIIVKRGENHGI